MILDHPFGTDIILNIDISRDLGDGSSSITEFCYAFVKIVAPLMDEEFAYGM